MWLNLKIDLPTFKIKKVANKALNISFAGYTGFLIIVWKEAIQNNPTPPETGRSDAIAFDVDQVFSIINCNPVVHIVEFWRSSDGVALDELIRSWSLDFGINSLPSIVQYDYVVDRGNTEGTLGEGDYWADPANEDDQIIDERLNGNSQDEIRFEQRGGIKYRNDEYELVTGGGVKLVNGTLFGDAGQTYTVTLFKQNEISSTSTTSSDYTDVKFVTANATLDNTFYRKTIIANKSGSGVLQIDFPDFLLITNTKMKFQTHQGNQDYLVLQFDEGNTLKYRGEDVNFIALGKGEEFEIGFKDNVPYVIQDGTNNKIVGKPIFVEVLGVNEYAFDGTQYSGAAHPRIKKFVTETLPPAQVKTFSDWSTSQLINYVVDQDGGVEYTKTIYPNKGFYAYDAVNDLIKVPDRRNMGVRTLKTFDNVDASDTERTSNKPGAYQVDSFRKHSHETGGLWNENYTTKIASGGNFNEAEYRVQRSGGEETRMENTGLIQATTF